MRRLNFLLIAVFLWNNTNGQDIGLQFAKSIKGATSADYSQISAIEVNVNGAMFTAGYFRGTVDFDPDESGTVNRTSTLISPGSYANNLFIARYNSMGELPNASSVITAGDQATQRVNDLSIYGQDIVVTGNLEGTASFAATLPLSNTITSKGNSDVFLAKFSETLVNKWAYAIGGTGVDYASGLEVDDAGNIYLTGAFRGTVDFDPSGMGNATTLTASGSNSDIFIAKYNTDGELLWAHGVGGSFADEGEDLVIDQMGNVYVTGTFYGNVDFDPATASSTEITSNASIASVFMAKYSANGNFIWARSVVGGESVAEIAINHNSDDQELAITGYFQQDNSDFDPGPGDALLPYESDVPDGFVGVYSNEGNYLWAKSIGGPDSDLEIPEGVSFGEDGSLFVSGGGGGTIDFNLQGAAPYSLTSQSGDGFLARYDASGAFQSAFLVGGTGSDWGAGHTIKDGNLILRGRIRSPSIDFDPSDDGTVELTSIGMEDAYFAKYDYSGPDLIQNNTAATATAGSNLNVSFEIEDAETGVQSVAADYRGVSSAADDPYKRVTLTNTSGNTYQGAIPFADFDELGIEFIGVATNNVGVTSTTLNFTANLSLADGLPIPQRGSGNGDQADYRIISMPLELQSKAVSAVFEDDLGPYDPREYRLFSYENGTTATELTSTSNIGIGKGYWIVIAGNDRPMDSGPGKTPTVSRSQFFTIDLVENWNLLGNPYNFNVSWADVQAVNAGLGSLKIYDGSFKNGDQLKKMEGGFVFAETAGTIEIPTTKKTSINGRKSDIQDSFDKKPLRRGEWEITLALKQGNSSYDLGGIGMRTDAEIEFDEYDDFSLPRIGNFIELNHDKELHGVHYSRDVIPPASKQVWVFTVTTAKGGSTSIKWDNTDIIGLNNDLVLVDLENQWPVDMKSHSEYTFASNGSHRFKTVYGNKEFVRKEIVADQFTLNGVYPNPTHSQNRTYIAFSVPENGYQKLPVSINVISMLGQTVVTLPPTYYEPGLHTVNLPLVTPKEIIPPGVYLVQVNYGDLKKQKRLIIKK